jgi:hypothetical protein
MQMMLSNKAHSHHATCIGTVGLNKFTDLSIPINSFMLSPDSKSDATVFGLCDALLEELKTSSTLAK